MSRIYWDSMLFIYLIEGNPMYAPRVKAIHEEMMRRRDQLVTSVFTLGEVLTGPRKVGAQSVVDRIRQFFIKSGKLELLPFTVGTSDRYSMIRASTAVTPADAIHLACAAESGVDLFITHDMKLQKLAISGIHFITGLNTNLF
ncbi:MAG: type II toxin-antitoxin system VapC family toxin [Terracidiphilus sp.]